jgi:trk system potassium uptake protein TrkH
MSHVVLLSLFLVGGMAGSTAGGPKVIRVLLLTRLATMQFFKLLHRRGVDVVRLGAHTVDDEILASTLGFVAMWGILLAIGTLALAASGTDVMTSFSAAAASLGNVGPAFGGAGPSQTFAHFDTWSKLVMELLMILGRLEIYTVLIVLTPGFWRF